MTENTLFERDGAIGYRLRMDLVIKTATWLHQELSQSDPTAPSIGALANCLLGGSSFSMSFETIDKILELLSEKMNSARKDPMAYFFMMENVLHEPMLNDDDGWSIEFGSDSDES